jgi:RNA polymerase sigma-70 factor, ECF subfamily
MHVRAALAETAEPLSDAQLVARFRAGESAAFDELVRRHQEGVLRLVRRYLRRDNEALDESKDIAQRAFVRAFQGIGRLRGDASFRPWVYQIAVNLALNHLRDGKRVQAEPDAGLDVPIAPIGAGALVDAEDDARLRTAITKLPPKQRLVLELRIYDELPFAEVALIADCTENAAKVSFHLAVKRLRMLLT